MSASLANLGFQNLWQETLGDPEVCIAILDGPVDRFHPSFIEATITYLDDCPAERNPISAAFQHGTHITSIIFAQHHSLVKGIAPRCRGIVIPILRTEGETAIISCSQTDLAQAIARALAAGAQVINISAGEFSRLGMAEPVLSEAVQRCVAAGVLIVAAVGNQGCDCLQIPGALPSVLAVGAMDAQGNPMDYSNWGDVYQTQGILAPGDRILGASVANGVTLASGTSYAAAIVSGVAGLLLSLQRQTGQPPDPLGIRQILLETALKAEADSPQSLAGRLNIAGAAAIVLQGSSVQPKGRLTNVGTGFHGDYVPQSWALHEKYQDVTIDKFGTVDIQLPNGGVYNVRDLHYAIGTGSIGTAWGMRLIPVSDEGDLVFPDGSKTAGYALIDDFLRREMGLEVTDPIYALVSYTRPDEHILPLSQLVHTRKLQLGHQHLAAYIGKGRTTHALERFPKETWKANGRHVIWNVKGYPANVHLISLQGVDQATLNRNAYLVDAILTAEVQAPVDTQNITCRTIDLNTTLQFYRDWIRDAEYLQDLTWYTNCSNHKTIVVNVALNLPHNLPMFEQVFGADGTQLWQDFQQKYAVVTGSPFTPADETYFQPLWHLEGLRAEQIRPLTLADYNRFQAAQLENRLDRYTNPRPLSPGEGMAWRLETLADLLAGLMGIYVSFPDVGGVIPALMLLALQAQVHYRIGIPNDLYREIIAPIVSQFLLADARVNAPQNPLWLRQTIAELYTGMGGNAADLQPGRSPDANLLSQVETFLEPARNQLDPIQQARPMTRFEAVFWLKQGIMPELESARRLAVGDVHQAGFFSSPGILQRISSGMYEKSPFVQIRTVCTVMDYSELQHHPRMKPTEFRQAQEAIDMSEDRAPFSQTLEPTTSQAIVPSAIEPSACSCEGAGAVQLVYALGKLDYDLVSQSRRDSIQQKMEESANPESSQQFLAYLDANPWDASAVQWTLTLDSMPIYVIQPQGAFARETYDLLRQFLREQSSEGVERISVPGVISGTTRLRSGDVVPVVFPEIRGMYSWTTAALVQSLRGERPQPEAAQADREAFEQVETGVSNFLDRVYFELRNLGQTPQERAINFAATNAFQIARVYESALREEMDLDFIDVERSPICRPRTDCWDVKLVFFFPQRQVQTVRKAYRFTVDVTDVVPVTVGQVRSWFIR